MLYLLLLVVFYTQGCGQNLRYEGILNDPAFDAAFDKGHDEITFSIRDNLANLNLYEYAHAFARIVPPT